MVPESANRTLIKNEPITSYVVKAKSPVTVQKAIAGMNSFLKAQMGDGNFNVYSKNQFLDESKGQDKMMSLVLTASRGFPSWWASSASDSGVLGSLIAEKLLLKMLLFPDTGLAVGVFLFSVLLGIGFGLYPAAKASELTPVEALRSE